MKEYERERYNFDPTMFKVYGNLFLNLTPVAGLNLLTEKVSRFSELSSEFEF